MPDCHSFLFQLCHVVVAGNAVTVADDDTAVADDDAANKNFDGVAVVVKKKQKTKKNTPVCSNKT